MPAPFAVSAGSRTFAAVSSYRELFHRIRQSLLPLYDAGEAAAIARELLLEKTGLGYSQGLIAGTEFEPSLVENMEASVEALKTGKPLQQILGGAWFLGRRFEVNEHVLIPRPETEELVDWIVRDWSGREEPFSILDVGAGSGCIGVSLALMLPAAAVSAVDVSGEALQVAQRNAALLRASVHFRQLDFLKEAAVLPQYDVVVSNPPYIPETEAASLHPNVRDFEPGTALFVPGNDPQLFYRHLAGFARTQLRPGGTVYCELHADFAEESERLFAAAGYQTELRRDLNGAWRMVKISRNDAKDSQGTQST